MNIQNKKYQILDERNKHLNYLSTKILVHLYPEIKDITAQRQHFFAQLFIDQTSYEKEQCTHIVTADGVLTTPFAYSRKKTSYLHSNSIPTYEKYKKAAEYLENKKPEIIKQWLAEIFLSFTEYEDVLKCIPRALHSLLDRSSIQVLFLEFNEKEDVLRSPKYFNQKYSDLVHSIKMQLTSNLLNG